MDSGLNVNDPTVVAAFHAALARQGLIALLIFALLSIAWVALRGRTSIAWVAVRGHRQGGVPGDRERASRAPGAADRLRAAVGA